ncbi:MAG: hypothetical protein ACOC6F_00910 [bacterium]
MKLTITLNGECLDLEAKYVRYKKGTLEAPHVGELWSRREVARGTRMELDAVADDGTEIEGIFRVAERRDDGTIEVEPWSGLDEVGGG